MARPAMSSEQRARLSAKAKAQWTPEKREQARLDAKARQSSSSTPSNDSGNSSAPPVLPGNNTSPSTSRLESLLETLTKTATKEKEKAPKLRELPESRDAMDRELALAQFPARLPVMAVSELFLSLGMRELSESEMEEGHHAWAALFWQLGLHRDGRVLVFLWLLGISAPRIADWARERKARKQGEAPAPRRERKESPKSPEPDKLEALKAKQSAIETELASLRESVKQTKGEGLV